MLLHKFGHAPVNWDEIYKEIFTQANNFTKHCVVQQ